MSRLVQELPQIISWIWALNTGACLGGKSSAKTMRRCIFSPVNNIIPHILRLSAVQQLKKKFSLRLAFLVKMYQDPGFVIRLASQKIFSQQWILS